HQAAARNAHLKRRASADTGHRRRKPSKTRRRRKSQKRNCNASCLVAERRWDAARWAIKAYAWRFAGVRRRSSRTAR
ncbi:hypothetical protein FV233_29695, partial [Methylobacterium sp. WL7]